MQKRVFLLLLASVLVSGCMSDQERIIANPAPDARIAEGERAAALCQQNMPNTAATETALISSGFVKGKEESTGAGALNFANSYTSADGTVVTTVGSQGSNEKLCLIRIAGMTPEQSVTLAQPWVQEYGALTNAERGQGLSRDAAQAWGSVESDRIIYISAIKNWRADEIPGGAVRMIHIQR